MARQHPLPDKGNAKQGDREEDYNWDRTDIYIHQCS